MGSETGYGQQNCNANTFTFQILTSDFSVHFSRVIPAPADNGKAWNPCLSIWQTLPFYIIIRHVLDSGRCAGNAPAMCRDTLMADLRMQKYSVTGYDSLLQFVKYQLLIQNMKMQDAYKKRVDN